MFIEPTDLRILFNYFRQYRIIDRKSIDLVSLQSRSQIGSGSEIKEFAVRKSLFTYTVIYGPLFDADAFVFKFLYGSESFDVGFSTAEKS